MGTIFPKKHSQWESRQEAANLPCWKTSARRKEKQGRRQEREEKKVLIIMLTVTGMISIANTRQLLSAVLYHSPSNSEAAVKSSDSEKKPPGFKSWLDT